MDGCRKRTAASRAGRAQERRGRPRSRQSLIVHPRQAPPSAKPATQAGCAAFVSRESVAPRERRAMSTSWPSAPRADQADTTQHFYSRSGGTSASRALHFQSDDDNKLLARTLLSRDCLWQVRTAQRTPAPRRVTVTHPRARCDELSAKFCPCGGGVPRDVVRSSR